MVVITLFLDLCTELRFFIMEQHPVSLVGLGTNLIIDIFSRKLVVIDSRKLVVIESIQNKLEKLY